MKTINKSLMLSAAAALSLFAACDDIEQADRLIDVERVHSEKVVLITEFSGQRCVNCPDGALIIHNVMEQYPGKVVAIAMHPPLATSFTNPIGPDIVRAQIANDYYSYYGNPAVFPCAAIDFGSINDNRSTWATGIVNAMSNQVPPASLFINPVYDENSKKITATCTVNFTENVSTDVSLVMWVLEDGIVGPQVTPSGMERQYVFNHILRASMNGTWGENIGSPYSIGDTKDVTAEIEVSDKWNPENLTIAVALLDARTHAALQAGSIKLMQ